MKDLTLRNIVSAVGGEFHGDAALLDKEISAVTTDKPISTAEKPSNTVISIKTEFIRKAYCTAAAILASRVNTNSVPFFL